MSKAVSGAIFGTLCGPHRTVDLPANSGTAVEIDLGANETFVGLHLYVSDSFYLVTADSAADAVTAFATTTPKQYESLPAGFYAFDISANSDNLYILGQAASAVSDGVSYGFSKGS